MYGGLGFITIYVVHSNSRKKNLQRIIKKNNIISSMNCLDDFWRPVGFVNTHLLYDPHNITNIKNQCHK